jgi:hypothetical protein
VRRDGAQRNRYAVPAPRWRNRHAEAIFHRGWPHFQAEQARLLPAKRNKYAAPAPDGSPMRNRCAAPRRGLGEQTCRSPRIPRNGCAAFSRWRNKCAAIADRWHPNTHNFCAEQIRRVPSGPRNRYAATCALPLSRTVVEQMRRISTGSRNNCAAPSGVSGTNMPPPGRRPRNRRAAEQICRRPLARREIAGSWLRGSMLETAEVMSRRARAEQTRRARPQESRSRSRGGVS